MPQATVVLPLVSTLSESLDIDLHVVDGRVTATVHVGTYRMSYRLEQD